jgi:aminopeptidase N
MRLVRLFFIPVLISFSSVAANDAIPMGRLPDSVEPRAYRLTLAIDPRQAEFSGAAEIDLSLREPARAIWLHGHGLRVSDVVLVTSGRVVKGRYAEVENVSGVARVDFDEEIAAGRAVLRLTYAAPFQKAPQGLYRTDVAGEWYAFSQLEPIDARRVFPGFDEPRFKTPFDVTVVADRSDKVVSNTPIASKTSERDRVRHRFVVTPPLPTYLLAFAVGPLDIVHAQPVPPSGVRRRPLPLRFVASKGQGKKLAFAARHTGEIVLLLEEYFGSAFPYPKLDLIASPIHGFAMENAGAIVFDDRHLLIGARPSPEQQSIFGGIVAHEIAHQWFGDLVTPVWWDDLWLNESFAQWLGSKISDRWRPGFGTRSDQLAATLKAMDTDALRVGRPMHQPLDDNRQIIGTFDEITYQKGAGVLAMFESYLGEARFRRGVRLHLRRHAHGSATADDFFAAMAEAAGEPAVLGAFRSFVDRPGVPFVTAVPSDDRSSLMLRQERYRPLGSAIAPGLLWDLPVCVRALSSADAPRRCVLMTGAAARIDLRAPAGETGVMPNAGGEGYYRFAVDAASVKSALRDVANLTGAEALALADSIGASFAAGRLPFEEVLRGASALVSHQDRTAATRLGFLLTAFHDQLRDAETRERLSRRIDGIYAPALRAFGYMPKAGAYAGDTADRKLRRDSLAEIVVVWGRDVEVTHTFASAAQATLANPELLDRGLRAVAWAAGVRNGDAAFCSALQKHLVDSADAQVRADAAYALGRVEQEPAASDVRALLLHPRLGPSPVFRILRGQLENPTTRASTWKWVRENADALIARLPANYQPVLLRAADRFCDATERDAVETLFAPRLAKAGIDALPLERELERISLCIALMSSTENTIKAAVEESETKRVR